MYFSDHRAHRNNIIYIYVPTRRLLNHTGGAVYENISFFFLFFEIGCTRVISRTVRLYYKYAHMILYI